jgi:hypothetical protein
MYSQSVVFPRLAVIQSAKWKDRNGLWFGFRIIHYAAHNTPSPATAVLLHTQSRVGIDHTRARSEHVQVQAARLKPTIEITAADSFEHSVSHLAARCEAISQTRSREMSSRQGANALRHDIPRIRHRVLLAAHERFAQSFRTNRPSLVRRRARN